MILNRTIVQTLRTQENLTQEGMAEKCKCHPRTIQRAERGNPVLVETAIDIAEVLGVHVHELIDRTPTAGITRKVGEVILTPMTSGTKALRSLSTVFATTFDCDVDPDRHICDDLEALEAAVLKARGDERNAEVPLKGRPSDLRLAAALQDAIKDLRQHGLLVYLGLFQSYQQVDRMRDNNGTLRKVNNLLIDWASNDSTLRTVSKPLIDWTLHAHVVISKQNEPFLLRTHDEHVEIQDPSLLEGGTPIFSGWRVEDLEEDALETRLGEKA